MPTAIWKSRLRSGTTHCDLEVAVEVRAVPTAICNSRLRCGSLGSGARGGGPTVPTGIWTARRRRRVRRRRRRRRTALIKSNNPHLAGGEKASKSIKKHQKASKSIKKYQKASKSIKKHCAARHQTAEPVTSGEDLRPIRAFDESGTSQSQLQDIVHDARPGKSWVTTVTQR